MPARFVLVLLVLALVVTGCGDDTPDAPRTEAPVTTRPTTAAPALPPQLADSETTTVTIDGEEWFVAVADTRELRNKGLRFVDDLGDLDGMLFIFDEEKLVSFTMEDTVIPLDIAFFNGAGRLVNLDHMVPCNSRDCPSYIPQGPVRYAVEAREGALIDIAPGAEIAFE